MCDDVYTDWMISEPWTNGEPKVNAKICERTVSANGAFGKHKRKHCNLWASPVLTTAIKCYYVVLIASWREMSQISFI